MQVNNVLYFCLTVLYSSCKQSITVLIPDKYQPLIVNSIFDQKWYPMNKTEQQTTVSKREWYSDATVGVFLFCFVVFWGGGSGGGGGGLFVIFWFFVNVY